MGERIKELRRAKGLTQQQFADRIGVKRNTIANYEIGRNDPVDSIVSLICREFGVSEEWLRTGSGDMFVAAPVSELDALAAKYPNMTHETYFLIEKLLSMSVEDQNVISGFMRKVVSGFMPDVDNHSRQDLHAELDRRIDEEKEAEARSEV